MSTVAEEKCSGPATCRAACSGPHRDRGRHEERKRSDAAGRWSSRDTGLALFAGGAAAGSALGGAAHDRRTATVRSACSTDDRDLLAAVELPDYRNPPRGDPSGGCVLHLHPRQDAGTAVADLTAGLERDGWRSTEERGDALTLERDGAVLSVVTVSDDKTTEILLTVH